MIQGGKKHLYKNIIFDLICVKNLNEIYKKDIKKLVSHFFIVSIFFMLEKCSHCILFLIHIYNKI
ncbi:hypothetical protein PFUGPA_04915 [Plasmodium falciparum Palo Alto/Uganda]|uniref:Uncharacterized protein n=2 Tax=Plasmodium falciparum TaxID=5833 RepID=W4ITF5_PLAFP|nr:hypothetical protein PFUGPA_04915 [Plasmodium falciparum Palo Alto/Uganda]EUR75567.1 hypothetical protein PFBG_01308 [Plasmodium falciparum 7G8]